MKRQTSMIAILLVLLVSIIPMPMLASNTTDDFKITKIEIEDKEFDVPVTNGNYGPVYAGERLKVKVFWAEKDLVDLPSVDDDGVTEAKITVEFADEEAETDYFTIREGWEGSETLYLDIDADAFDIDNENDFERDYRLHVTMENEDGDNVEVDDITLRVVNQRHNVEIYDINFPNGREVKAGQVFQANIGVKNLGHSTEEDIRVTLSIPELGLSTRSDRFDLYTENEYLNDEWDDDDFYYKLYKTLFLTVPLNTVSGVYDAEIEVEYNDGDSVTKETTSIIVSSGVAPSDAVINMVDTSENVAKGQGTVYKIMFANLGNQAGTYTVEVSGVSGWGTARVDPSTFSVGADETREVFVFVSADEDASLGNKDFTVKVLAGNSIVKEFKVNANVVASTSGDVGSVKEGLQVGFLILLVVLVILGIILVAKKLGKNSKDEEPFIEEDQTYY